MNQTKKELFYFRLKLEGYLRDHHPELRTDSAFIGARTDLALSSYCDSVAQGFSHLEAEARTHPSGQQVRPSGLLQIRAPR